MWTLEIVKEMLDYVMLAEAVADKFIAKVENWRARSVETYSEMKELKEKAVKIKEAIKQLKIS